MDLNSQINSSKYLQMEDQLKIEEIDRSIDFPISTARTRELSKVEDSGLKTQEDLYSFINSFMGSGSLASAQQSVNPKHMRFVNEQTGVSDVS